jgi:predicted small metal-binding protein
MAKTVSCRDVGADCDFVARGNSEEEIMSQVAEHARTEHNYGRNSSRSPRAGEGGHPRRSRVMHS